MVAMPYQQYRTVMIVVGNDSCNLKNLLRDCRNTFSLYQNLHCLLSEPNILNQVY